MNENDDQGEIPPCDAGRTTPWGSTVEFGGAWTEPCEQPGRHQLAFSAEEGGNAVAGTPILSFCDVHVKQLIDAGLIDEVALDALEWEQRVRAGHEPRND